MRLFSVNVEDVSQERESRRSWWKVRWILLVQNVHYYQKNNQNRKQESCQMKGYNQLTQPHCETEELTGQHHWFHHQYPAREELVLCWLWSSINTATHVREQPKLSCHSDTTVKLSSSTDVVICCTATWRFSHPLSLLSFTTPVCSALFCPGWVQKSRLNIAINTD